MNYTLKDLLDIPRLQDLLQSLDQLHRVPSAIIDTEGEILAAVAWQEICTNFHRVNPETKTQCIESDRHIYDRIDETMAAVVYRCPMGLIDSATPIFVEGKHLGNIFTGQLFVEPPDEHYFAQQARQYGFDEDAYLTALRKVPVFTEDKLRRNLDFLRQLTQILAEQCLQTKRQLEAQQALKRSEQELNHSHDLMRYIIEHDRSAIAVHDRDLRYVYVSQRYLQEYGVNENDIIGKSHYEVFPDLPEKWRDVHRRALAGEVCSAENDAYVRDDGSVEWTRWECRPWYEADGSIGGIIVYTEVITDRKQAEEELSRSKERLEAMMNALPDLMFRIDREGRIHEYHSAASEDLFVEPKLFLGKTMQDVLPEGAAQVIMSALEEAAVTGKHRGAIYSLQMPSGEAWYELSIAAMGESPQGAEQYILLSRDVTTRKKMEERVRSSEENYRNICELTSDFVHRCSRRGNEPFHLEWAAGGLRKITGYCPEEVIEAGCWLPFVHPDDRDGVAAHLGSLTPGDRASIEFRMLTKQGDTRWMLESSTCITGNEGQLVVLGASTDITDRKKYEEALQLTRVSVEAASDSILWIKLDGRIVDVNPAACRSLGYTREELLQLRVPDIDPHYGAEVWSQHFAELRKQGTVKLESEQRTKDGRLLPVEIVANYVNFGAEERNCAFVRDISERRRAEEQRHHLEQQLLHAQKLESLGVLAGGIAHDFNNILTSIIGNAELALMRLNPESPAQENLQRIEKAAGRAADLARQMLAYSGKGKFVVETIDLNRLVEEMGHMLEVSISKKAVLHYNFTRPLPCVEADATQIRQIIMNLVINSSEAIGDKSGIIAINTGCLLCDEKYLQGTWLTDQIPDGFYVFVEIADSGCGMDKETLGKIFDPFFSTKFAGRGLGMSAVLGIVRGHKGTIKVYSEPGKGTTFKVLLPASGKPAEMFNGDLRKSTRKGEGCVLLVDDEETVRAIGSEMLREMGYSPVTANDGREALEIFRATPEIAFVILDLTMPHMDGEQCFRELRKLDPQVKVYLSSGFSEYEINQKFTGKGLAGFIQKPYKMSTLYQLLLDPQTVGD